MTKNNKNDRSMLTLSRDEMRRIGYRAVDILVDYFSTVAEKPVATVVDRKTSENLFLEPPPEEGRDIDQVLKRVTDDLMENLAHVNHPRFFAFVSGPGNYIGTLADFLASGFNVFSCTWLESSAASELEIVTVDWLRQMMGMPTGAGGIFVSGGSAANMTGLAVARAQKLGGPDDSARAYFSDQTHSSVERGLLMLGFRPDAIRKLPSKDDFTLDPEILRKAVSEDRDKGLLPFAVVGNAGAVNTGAADPMDAIADICADENLWFHVDGAYAAPAILTDEGKAAFAGLGRADSITVDPHKWLFQPLEIGCVLVKDAAHLFDTFHIFKEYIADADADAGEVNFGDWGMQLSRGFRALKLWMTIQVFGMRAIREAVAWGLEQAREAGRMIEGTEHLEIVTPPSLGVVTFRYRRPGFSEDDADRITGPIVEDMTKDGYALVTSTQLWGRPVLRLCTINPRTTLEDIQETLNRIVAFGDRREVL
ncbi:MAG: hypothetical protein JW885_16660 [Deltaproteobacteria bacterium]|nr:hypothetical protein [Candidatus Zymogenaceae bacterium]